MLESVPDLSLSRIRHLVGRHSPLKLPVPGLRPAAVLVPLFQSEETAPVQVWLMRRPVDGTPHSGQVALPGGKPTAQDGGLQGTALREAHEEIGLAPESVEVLGQLDDHVTITGFRITPFVGWIRHAFLPTPNPSEVARVFSVPLQVFFAPGTKNPVRLARFERRVLSYAIDGEVVWGATGAILRKFADLLR